MPSHFQDLTAPTGYSAAISHARPAAAHASRSTVTAEECVLHPDNFEPILTIPVGPNASPHTRERHQRSDVNKARHCSVSNPKGKPSRSHTQKVGTLTSQFALDQPTTAGALMSRDEVLKLLSELRIPVLTDDDPGGYITAGRDKEGDKVEDIESFSDSEGEADRRAA